mmetsp:Transcript_7620/g.12103  ORF Transcript_7620/g.12103 Transcript_7620/m.12103 type:complete len:209 (+) Transcript_7620:126-752(+)
MSDRPLSQASQHKVDPTIWIIRVAEGPRLIRLVDIRKGYRRGSALALQVLDGFQVPRPAELVGVTHKECWRGAVLHPLLVDGSCNLICLFHAVAVLPVRIEEEKFLARCLDLVTSHGHPIATYEVNPRSVKLLEDISLEELTPTSVFKTCGVYHDLLDIVVTVPSLLNFLGTEDVGIPARNLAENAFSFPLVHVEGRPSHQIVRHRLD